MSTYFLDTNILLRHLLNDDPVHSSKALAIIQAIEAKKCTAWTTDLVVAEVVFVLSSKRSYNQTPQQIADAFLPLFKLPSLRIPRKRVHIRAFALYTQYPIDYIDAYHAALMEHREEHQILTFDDDFDRIPGVTRGEEPTL